jgi:hypothetical protein
MPRFCRRIRILATRRPVRLSLAPALFMAWALPIPKVAFADKATGVPRGVFDVWKQIIDLTMQSFPNQYVLLSVGPKWETRWQS